MSVIFRTLTMQFNTTIPDDIQLLMVSYITNDIESKDFDLLKSWIQSKAENRKLFNQFVYSWVVAGNSGKQEYDSNLLWNRIENEINSVDEKGSQYSIQRNNFIFRFRYVAIWLLVVSLTSAVTWFIAKHEDLQSKTTEYIVPKGSKSTVKLPDGSVVWLNAGSKLVYANNFDQKDRNVYLTGEAYFSVVSNKEKPFKVHTSDLIVRALGTKFNVKAYPEEKTITTTLEEGIIDVQIIKGSKEYKNREIKIKPKERLVFFKSGESSKEEIVKKTAEEAKKIQLINDNIKVELDVNTELYTSWKSDKWVIEGLTLKCLAPMLERRYNMKMHFANDGLDQYKFTGILQNETIEQILNVITYTAPIKYSIVKDSVYLTLDYKLKSNFEKIITTRNE